MKTIRLFSGFALAVFLVVSATRADDWPQWMGPQRDGVWSETGLVEKLPTNGPTVLWRKSESSKGACYTSSNALLASPNFGRRTFILSIIER